MDFSDGSSFRCLITLKINKKQENKERKCIMKKKFVAMIVCVVMMIGTLAGCGGNANESPDKSSDKSPDKSSNTDIYAEHYNYSAS